jgi:hypothetical protein
MQKQNSDLQQMVSNFVNSHQQELDKLEKLVDTTIETLEQKIVETNSNNLQPATCN